MFMEEIYAEILKALEKKEKLALATLITRVGSAPRGVGAKYLIKEDGSSLVPSAEAVSRQKYGRGLGR
jgi:hypothetical protein